MYFSHHLSVNFFFSSEGNAGECCTTVPQTSVHQKICTCTSEYTLSIENNGLALLNITHLLIM